MSKSLDGTIQIVTAKLSNQNITINKSGGKDVAEMIHEIYKELSAIEIAEETKSGYVSPSVELKD